MSKHIWLPILVSVLALAFLDPFQALMPMGVAWLVLGGLMLATISYGLFLLTAKVNDEREVSIRAFADRASCLTGMMLLVSSIAYRLYVDGHVYSELIIILVIMIIVKSVSYQYACHNK